MSGLGEFGGDIFRESVIGVIVTAIAALATGLAGLWIYYVHSLRRAHPAANILMKSVFGSRNSRSDELIKKSLNSLSRKVMRSRLSTSAGETKPYDLLMTVRARIEAEICHGTLGRDLAKKEVWTESSHHIFCFGESEPLPVINLQSLGSLTDEAFKDNVDRYFGALSPHNSAQLNGRKPGAGQGSDREIGRPEFISKIHIEDGFVAPLLLLGGLLEYVKNDWKSIIDTFGADTGFLDDPLELFPQLRKLQAFLYDCWLIWGPSIPVCGGKCPQWNPAGEDIVLQFGYGDENSSIIIIAKKRAVAFDATNFSSQLAVRARASGRLKYGSNTITADEDVFPLALKGAMKADGRRLVLDIRDSGNIVSSLVGSKGKAGTPYYSAYLWVMFIIVTGGGIPIHKMFPGGDKPIGDYSKADSEGVGLRQQWRSFLPFFEHGNIADPAIYPLLRQQLAKKAVSTIHDLAKEMKLDGTGLRFAYACGIDDPGCHAKGTTNGLVYPQDKNALSILEEMKAAVAVAPYLSAKESRPIEIIDFDWHLAGEINVFSSCRLPQIIGKYYEAVEKDLELAK